MAHLPPSPVDLVDHPPSESPESSSPLSPLGLADHPPSELSKSSSPTRMEDDGLEENVKESEELIKKYLPCLKMEFESVKAAFEFYNEYARITGFSVKICYSNLSKRDGVMISRKFACNKEGQKAKDKRNLVVERPHKDTRTNCLASLFVSLDRGTSKWVVKSFEENHNHLLHILEHSHLLKSHRMVSEAQAINIDIAADIGLSLKASHDLLSAQAGGKECLGFTREDQKNYLRSRRQRSLKYGESGALLGYFRNQSAQNPYFYYAVQLDVDEKITNIFWADHEMITDYGLFGDAVSFDTTFRTNKECRPFALFTGFNHFRMTTIFGAALLYDETADSFEWLFKTFLHAMSGKKPTTIFTDQDAAMAKAISNVMPDVSHGLCTFHLNQNALKHLGYLLHADSNFGKELNACIFGYEEINELEKAWHTLIKKYNLQDNSWMAKTWEIREKWAHVYMKWSYIAGMWSTQLSESLNAKLKRCLKSDLNIVQFLTQFDIIVVEKRYEESKAIYNSREKLQRLLLKKSPMLIQVAQLYSPPLFDLFHDELDTSLRCKVKQCHELEGQFSCVITMRGQNVEYVVKGNVEIDETDETICRDVCCTCRKFESFRILCSHAIKGLDRMSVMEIPERIICPKMVKLATQSCELEETYEFVEETLEYMCAKVADTLLGAGEGAPIEVEKELEVDPQFARVKGLKKKNGIQIKGTRRLKPWHELKSRKRKKVVSHSTTQLSEHVDHVATTKIVHGSVLKQPSDVGIPYVPQMISYEDSGQSIPSSSQASCNPQTLKEIAI
ncbi:protein FAR1-RELATED SEQUENCE 5-like [Rhododendron vialii]|uniref:protein FAR1-RELATED SEQUENCE 5-like n=1 Tax=Rhododendron vialii TaxID=182163 RepID=UPI00265E8C6F|nr:protein FAR1-RELATED SEQUENCE 5-like [Rhododendron vialii]